MRRVKDIIRDLETRDLLEIATQIARKHFVTLEELLGRGRHSLEARARHELWYCLYDQIPSFPKLGEIFGRDHTTILLAVHKYQSTDRGSATQTKASVHVSCAPSEQSECRDSAPRPSIKKCGAFAASPVTEQTGS